MISSSVAGKKKTYVANGRVQKPVVRRGDAARAQEAYAKAVTTRNVEMEKSSTKPEDAARFQRAVAAAYAATRSSPTVAANYHKRVRKAIYRRIGSLDGVGYDAMSICVSNAGRRGVEVSGSDRLVRFLADATVQKIFYAHFPEQAPGPMRRKQANDADAGEIRPVVPAPPTPEPAVAPLPPPRSIRDVYKKVRLTADELRRRREMEFEEDI